MGALQLQHSSVNQPLSQIRCISPAQKTPLTWFNAAPRTVLPLRELPVTKRMRMGADMAS